MIGLQKNDFMDTIYGRVSRNSEQLDSFKMVKIILYSVLSITVIVIIGCLMLSSKVNRLSKFLALDKLIKPSTAFPVEGDSQVSFNDNSQLTWEVLLIFVLILTKIYFAVKNLKRFQDYGNFCMYSSFLVNNQYNSYS